MELSERRGTSEVSSRLDIFGLLFQLVIGQGHRYPLGKRQAAKSKTRPLAGFCHFRTVFFCATHCRPGQLFWSLPSSPRTPRDAIQPAQVHLALLSTVQTVIAPSRPTLVDRVSQRPDQRPAQHPPQQAIGRTLPCSDVCIQTGNKLPGCALELKVGNSTVAICVDAIQEQNVASTPASSARCWSAATSQAYRIFTGSCMKYSAKNSLQGVRVLDPRPAPVDCLP